MTSLKPPLAASDAVPIAPAGVRAVIIVDTLAIAVAALVTIAFLGKLFMRSDLGYDFTDEGFVLNWISRPSDYPISLTQFGYIYHPLYELMGRSISLLRQSTILISYVLAITVCLSLLRRCVRETGGQFSLSFGLIGLSIGTASCSSLVLVFASSLWLPIPSYNSLTFQSLLVASIGFCLAEPSTSRTSIAGWIIIGVGGFLAFMGKPPSAFILGIVTLLNLLIGQKLRWRLAAIPIGTFCLLLAVYAWLVDGSIAQFATDLRRSLDTLSVLEAGHTVGHLLRFDDFHLAFDEICVLAASTLLIVSLTLATYSRRPAVKLAGALTVLALASVALALGSEIFTIEFQDRTFQGLQFLAVVLAGIICFAANSYFRCGSSVSRQLLASGLFFVLLPFAYVVGTANNYWRVAPSAAFFWTLSSFSLLGTKSWGRASWRHLSPLAISSLAMTIVIVEHSMAHPYRDPNSLNASTVPVQMRGAADPLLLNPNFAAYLDQLRRLSHKAGFQADTPMIDLTGHYPGSLYALAAKPVGAAWLIGGYPGSDKLAAANLDIVSCQELVRSWVLTEPNGPRRLSPNLLKRYGIDLQHDFEIAGTLDAPIGEYPTSYKQELLKPTRDSHEALSACETARRTVN